MSVDLFKVLTVVNSLLSSSNFLMDNKRDKKISSIQSQLSYIRDDISWIESTEIDKLLSNQSTLRASYEKDLAELFSSKQLALELESAISNLTTSDSFSDPKVYDVMLASLDNIDLLLSSTSNTLMQLFNINEATLDKVLKLINEINSLKLRFNLDNADLQLKISDNSRLIIKLSEQQLAHQLSTLQKFEDLRSDLEIINAQVDKKLASFGVLSTNTTGVLLADGTFKLADTLSLIQTDVFDITLSETIHSSSTSIANIANSHGLTSNIPYITGYSQGINDSYTFELGNSATSCNKLNMLSSTLIKKFSKANHSGVGLLLNKPYKLLVSGINPQRELFLFLKGAGLSSFNESGLSVEFVPALAKFSSISYSSFYQDGYYTYNHNYSSATIRNTSWGQPGSYKIPSFTTHVKIGTIFTTSLIQKSDELIVIKVKLSSNYSSVLASGSISGAIVSGSGIPSSNSLTTISGGFFSIPNVGEILAGGSFIINLPVNHLSFAGVECAQ